MKELALTAASLLILVIAWLLWGILQAIRDVLAERTASWLLPPQQSATFRFAQFLAFLARALGPRRYPVWEFDSPSRHSWYLVFPVRWRNFHWLESEAVLAELESDLRAERQVLDPVRLVAPLLAEAMKLRLFYLRKLMLYLAWVPFGLVLYSLLMTIVTFGLDSAAEYAWRKVRRRLRRRGSGAGR